MLPQYYVAIVLSVAAVLCCYSTAVLSVASVLSITTVLNITTILSVVTVLSVATVSSTCGSTKWNNRLVMMLSQLLPQALNVFIWTKYRPDGLCCCVSV